jgi:prevent-host-death family protein
MAKRYSSSSYPSLKVQELPPVTATALKNSAADVLDQVAAHGAVAITKHDKPRAVLVSIEQYERMMGAESNLVNELQAEYRGMLEKMQEPEQKAAAEHLFKATPEELGAAAVRGARRKGKYRT